MGLFTKLKADGAAFIKTAEADAKELEAKGRIVALDAVNTAKANVIEFLKTEVARVHADADKIKADFDDILAKL